MREIKFAGKVADEPDEWVIGYLCSKDTIYQEKEHKGSKCCGTGTFKVREETVRQYTGLKDKNGVEIYEGDILERKLFYKKDGELFHKAVLIVSFDIEKACFIITEQYEENKYQRWERKYETPKYKQVLGSEVGIKLSECEVIGNIYDNPELLEVKGAQRNK